MKKKKENDGQPEQFEGQTCQSKYLLQGTMH